MEWYPSDKMTVDDLKAVLMSWRIELPHKASKDMLQKLAAKEFKAIMQRLYGYAPIVTSVRRPVASSSCAASDKSVGTDLPMVETSYIGSDAGSERAPPIIDNTMITKLIINDLAGSNAPACVAPSAACAAEVEHVAEPGVVSSAACAAEVEHVPSLRRAVELEILATAKAKMMKKTTKAEKADKAESLRSAFKTAESLRSAVEKETMAYTQAKIARDKADAKKKDSNKDPGDVAV